MKITFSKYHGAGNDFILVDNRAKKYRLSTKEIAELCHRRFGIGADGLMLLEKDKASDFKMIYYNSDGKEGSMCGNGGRCIVAFAYEIGIQKETYLFTATDGLHEAFFDKNKNEVNLKMTDVDKIQKFTNDWFLDTGSPHAVEIVKNIDSINVAEEGKKLRYDTRFGEAGCNVNFVEINNGNLKIRTFERGVEAETLACGTGAVASAIIAHRLNSKQHKFSLKALGGNLEVTFENKNNNYSNIWLKGPVKKVFSGNIETL
jgi:diaminopimelate epimerase